MANYSVFGVGNPLMDMIGHVSHEHLQRVGAQPGTMNLVDGGRAARIAAGLTRPGRRPGGSCANTLRGLAWLSGQADAIAPPVMTGVVGDDAIGRDLRLRLEATGVVSALSAHPDKATGTSVVLVTPDGQRTMFTSLEACLELSEDHLDRAAIACSDCFYATAYLWAPPGPRSALTTAAAAARAGGAMVAFDVADMVVVRNSGHELVEWIPGSVDLLLANEQEARTLAEVVTGMPAEGPVGLACAALGKLAPTVAVKLGPAGSMVWERGAIAARAPGLEARVVDTTGAGDSFAAGYLYARLTGGGPEEAASLGNRVAAAIVEVEGCDYSAVVDGTSFRGSRATAAGPDGSGAGAGAPRPGCWPSTSV